MPQSPEADGDLKPHFEDVQAHYATAFPNRVRKDLAAT